MNIDRQTLNMITVLSVLGAALAALWATSSGTVSPANAAGVAYAVLATLLAKATGCSALMVLVCSPFLVAGAVLRAIGSLLLAFF
ncbi:hypothetical protein [Streptomyces sp. NRRL S-495]|uniref:hypothetical protein n=1 Tax=Streptomyces sp. NRRL S-495 TaxID=1609133 RepID=UPI0005F93EC7|nr:hypothetical protein [Streptomyces sp. NRRL S-495]KJY32151.1 hypothetical protein VR45_23325 [Streptomyces sp. NRRL S-495]